LPELLPVDRGHAPVRPPPLKRDCTGWDKCNMCGYKCGCCDDGLGDGQCPNCASWNGYWTGCCCDSSIHHRITIQYWDCMRNTCSQSKVDQCHTCAWCNNGCPQPQWSTGSVYMCTKVVQGDDCGTC